MNMLNSSHADRFELTQTQSDIKKEPSKKALYLNGGNNVVRLEPYLEKIRKQIFDKESEKVLCMLNQWKEQYAV